ncbi:DUF2782 domain-containing protein [Sulfuriflexus sp.]|uniref:DUF2782 domain-containing protein n=1 Tax=Sulfuriflexus sp. TaxID=2015443 RepID=UPI0028CC5C47|nr:DUF2782 domain-containing protein [Sulfuriflexus sp.]MDT8404824.1 DUF2782 domain-containing protein [Sulfuriflexus sp.]
MHYAIKTFAALLFASSLTLPAFAEERAPVDDAVVPPPPPRVQSGETLEPDVTIIEKDRQRIEQYSINGQVYAAKITPVSGPSYYLIDTDGDGSLETRKNDIERNLQVPQWILFSWE